MLNDLLNKFCVVLVLFAILGFSFGRLPVTRAGDEAYVDEVLVFLRDLVKLDMAKYTVTSYKPSVAYWDKLGGLPQLTGIIVLNCWEPKSTLGVTYSFVNNTFNSIGINIREGSPIYSQTFSANAVEVAKAFMERYQAFTGNNDLAAMRSILDSVDKPKNVSIVSGNLRLQVIIDSSSSSFDWKYTYNGANYAGIHLYFWKGNFESFGDDTSYHKVGGTDVNITAEEAIKIALKRAENYTFKYDGEVFSNFNIVMNRTGAELLVMGRDNPLVGFPYWTVSLVLDHVYPGFITWIEVRLWADTGEIIDIKPMGYGGEPPPTELPPTDSNPELTEEPTNTTKATGMSKATPDLASMLVISGMVSAIIAMSAIAAYAINKRRSR
jgi:hypothetical protein